MHKLKKYEYWDDPDTNEEKERVPVNARHIRNFIMVGCFDKLKHVKGVAERYAILVKATKELGFRLKEDEFSIENVNKHYFWLLQQIAVSGFGRIDYRRIYDNSALKRM